MKDRADRQNKVHGKKEDLFGESKDLDVIEILQRMQRQMVFLERKVDHLTDLLENKSVKKPQYSRFSGEGERSYRGSKEGKFSRGFSRGDDRSSGGAAKEQNFFPGKPFGKPSGRSFDGPRSKGASKKKKVFFAKRSPGKYQGKMARKDA